MTLFRAGFYVEVVRVVHAQRLGDYVAVRMGARLVDADRALRDQFLHVAVVLRQLRQLLLVPQVDAAVADPGDLEAVAGDARGHHGGAHGQRIAALARGADDFLVGDPDRLRPRRALAALAHDRLAGQGAGDLAVLFPPPSVGPQPPPHFTFALVPVLLNLAPQAPQQPTA